MPAKYLMRERRNAVLAVLPAVLCVFSVQAYSLVTAFIKSFTNWDGMFKNTWVGLLNYRAIFAGREFWTVLKNSCTFLLFIPIQLLLGLVLGMLFFEEIKGWKFFRSVFCLPQVISTVITGYLFKVFFSFEGPVNTILQYLGLQSQNVEWMGKAMTAFPVMILCLVWMNLGWQGLVVSGGMSAISASVYEAARIDGANFVQRLIRITIPMLNRTIEYSVVMSVILAFSGMFPLIHAMTKGGPGYSTTTLDYIIYTKSFVSGTQMGISCAYAFILFVIILAFTVVEMRVSNKLDDWRE